MALLASSLGLLLVACSSEPAEDEDSLDDGTEAAADSSEEPQEVGQSEQAASLAQYCSRIVFSGRWCVSRNRKHAACCAASTPCAICLGYRY
jgi:hypothetical protein